jgi:hypothetical protein
MPGLASRQSSISRRDGSAASMLQSPARRSTSVSVLASSSASVAAAAVTIGDSVENLDAPARVLDDSDPASHELLHARPRGRSREPELDLAGGAAVAMSGRQLAGPLIHRLRPEEEVDR